MLGLQEVGPQDRKVRELASSCPAPGRHPEGGHWEESPRGSQMAVLGGERTHGDRAEAGRVSPAGSGSQQRPDRKCLRKC